MPNTTEIRTMIREAVPSRGTIKIGTLITIITAMIGGSAWLYERDLVPVTRARFMPVEAAANCQRCIRECHQFDCPTCTAAECLKRCQIKQWCPRFTWANGEPSP